MSVWGHLEDRAVTVFSALDRGAVEVPVIGQDQPREGETPVQAAKPAEAIKRRQWIRAGGADFKDCPITVGPAAVGNPVEVPIGELDQPSDRGVAVCQVEAVHRRQDERSGINFEDCPISVGPAFGGSPVEVPIRALNQVPHGSAAVRHVEAMQRGEYFGGRADFEDCPRTPGRAHVVGPALHRRPVEVPIAGLDQPTFGGFPVQAMVKVVIAKAVNCRQGADAAVGGGRISEDRAVPIVEPTRRVVPSKLPSLAWTSPATGISPSTHWLKEQKLYSVVTAPRRVILKRGPAAEGPFALRTGCPIEFSIKALEQRGIFRECAVGVVEAGQRGICADSESARNKHPRNANPCESFSF